MKQFDKKQKIVFDIQDTNSIQQALHEYKKLLETGEAIDKSDIMGQFDVEFLVKTLDGARRLQVKDTQNIDLVKESLNMGQEGGSHNYPNLIKEDSEVYISEILFFAIALEYPELKDDIFAAAQAMVNISRYNNDGSDMWIDDMRVFGVEALYILAKVYPEYSYLLAQFLIPYWDDEHAVGYEEYLHRLVQNNGWTRDNIKAFIWCDNNYFRQAMNLENNLLGNFLKKNSAEYIYFKQEMQNRLTQQQILLAYEDEDNGSSPILQIYFSMMVSPKEWEEDINEGDDILEAFFINDTLENEALQFEEELLKVLEKPITTLSESEMKEKQFSQDVDDYYDNYKTGDALIEIIDLFSHLSEGEKICNYITIGEDKGVLDTLTTVDFIAFAKKYSQAVYNKTIYFTSYFRDNNEVREELDSIISNLTNELLSPKDDSEEEVLDNGMIVKTISYKKGIQPIILSKEEKKALQAKYLRILDVFYIILGREILSDNIFDLIANSNNDPIISQEEFYMRYGGRQKDESNEDFKRRFGKKIEDEVLKAFTNEYSSNLNKEELTKADQLHTYRNAISCSSWDSNHPGSYALATYLLYKDFMERIGDETTHMFNNFISEGATKVFAEHILNFLKKDEYYEDKDVISEKDKIQLKEYLTAPIPEITHDNAVMLLKQYSIKEDAILKIRVIVLACYWLAQMPLPSAIIPKRIWKLCVSLAPQKTIKIITEAYISKYDHIFEGLMDEIEHYERLEKIGMPKAQVLAFQMVVAQENLTRRENKFRRDYEVYLDMYDEIDAVVKGTSIFSGMDKKNALALDEGMYSIKEKQRVTFFRHLALHNSRFPFNQQEIFKHTIERLVKENLASLPKQILNLFSEEEVIFNESNYKLSKLLKDIPIYEDENTFIANFSSEATTYPNEIVMVLQECENRFHIVVKPIIEAFNFDNVTHLDEIPFYINIIVLEQSADTNLIKKLFKNKPNMQERVNKVTEYFMAYLDGEINFSEILEVFHQEIQKKSFEEKFSRGSGVAKISDFMGILPENKLERMIKLLLTHTTEAFNVLKDQIDISYLEHQVLKEKITFRDYLYELSDREIDDDTIMSWLLKKIIDIEIPMENIIKIVAEAASHYNIKEIIDLLATNKEFMQLLNNTSKAERRYILAQLNADSEEE